MGGPGVFWWDCRGLQGIELVHMLAAAVTQSAVGSIDVLMAIDKSLPTLPIAQEGGPEGPLRTLHTMVWSHHIVQQTTSVIDFII